MTEPAPPRLIRARCPICGRPSAVETRPFCSRRCSDIDLARWLGGAYVVPERDDEEGAENARPRAVDDEA